MSSKIFILACVSAVALGLPYPPPGYCVVNLNGSPYTSLALRSTPCNNEPAILYMNNGQEVKMLSTNDYYGCGWEYLHVSYTDSHGNTYSGYAGEAYLMCNEAPQQSCGTWCLKNGGPPNACGTGYTYTAGNNAMCDESGDNCKTECCTKNPVVYRRDTQDKDDQIEIMMP
jgi:hypothetical protein